MVEKGCSWMSCSVPECDTLAPQCFLPEEEMEHGNGLVHTDHDMGWLKKQIPAGDSGLLSSGDDHFETWLSMLSEKREECIALRGAAKVARAPLAQKAKNEQLRLTLERKAQHTHNEYKSAVTKAAKELKITDVIGQVSLEVRSDEEADMQLMLTNPSSLRNSKGKGSVHGRGDKHALASTNERLHYQVGIEKLSADGSSVLHQVVLEFLSYIKQAHILGERIVKAKRERCARLAAFYCLAGASLEVVDRLGVTPFLLAVKCGAVAIARIYIASGADIHVKNAQKFHSLLVAAEQDQPGTFKTILNELKCREKKGDSTTLATYAKYVGDGYTPLHFAVINNSLHLLRAAFDFEEFKDPEIINARSTNLTTGCENPTVDSHHVKHQTALHKSIIYGHISCCRLLLSQGALPDVPSIPVGPRAKPRYPLQDAILKNDMECTRILLEYNADATVYKDLHELNLAGENRCVAEVQAHLHRQGSLPKSKKSDAIPQRLTSTNAAAPTSTTASPQKKKKSSFPKNNAARSNTTKKKNTAKKQTSY